MRVAVLHAGGCVLDWVLAKPRTEYLVASVTTLTAAHFVRTVGFAGLLANLDNVLAAGDRRGRAAGSSYDSTGTFRRPRPGAERG